MSETTPQKQYIRCACLASARIELPSGQCWRCLCWIRPPRPAASPGAGGTPSEEAWRCGRCRREYAGGRPDRCDDCGWAFDWKDRIPPSASADVTKADWEAADAPDHVFWCGVAEEQRKLIAKLSGRIRVLESALNVARLASSPPPGSGATPRQEEGQP
jgi:hypothetical protein